MRTALFRGLLAATAGLWLVIVLWSAPRIAAGAGGLAIFDLRPGGYDLAEARAFLAALDGEARAFYRDVQLRLDRVYPALLALTLGWATLRQAPGLRHRGLLAVPAGFAAAFDYAENELVARMLAADPATLAPDLVATASLATQGKTGATVLAVLVLAAAGARARLAGRRAG